MHVLLPTGGHRKVMMMVAGRAGVQASAAARVPSGTGEYSEPWTSLLPTSATPAADLLIVRRPHMTAMYWCLGLGRAASL